MRSPSIVPVALLARPNRTLYDRRNNLQVRRVERQRQVHLAAGGGYVRGKSLVVFDVAGSQILAVLVLEFREQHRGQLAKNIHQHVKAATMRHSHDDFLDALRAGTIDQFTHQGYQALAAFQRKTFLPDVFRMQVTLDTFCRGQALQQPYLLVGGDPRVRLYTFETLLDPAFFLRRGHVHVFRTDGLAVGTVECNKDVIQRRLLRPDQRTGTEHGIEILFGKLVIAQVKLAHRRRTVLLQRVGTRVLMSAKAIGIDQLQHAHLLALELEACLGDACDAVATQVAGQFREFVAQLGMKDIIDGLAVDLRQLLKPGMPALIDRVRIPLPALVE